MVANKNKKTAEYYKWIGTRHFTYVNDIDVDDTFQERIDLDQRTLDLWRDYDKEWRRLLGLFTYANGSIVMFMQDGTFRNWNSNRIEYKTLDEVELNIYKKLQRHGNKI